MIMSVTQRQQNEAIRTLRRRSCGSTQRSVARAIVGGGYPMFALTHNVSIIVDNELTKRSFYSVYNVIRRHDALERQKRIAAEVGSEPGNLDLGSNA